VFVAAEAKVKDCFVGNVVDLGAFRFDFAAFTSSEDIDITAFQAASTLLCSLRKCSIRLRGVR
jgi:hypothetical protein